MNASTKGVHVWAAIGKKSGKVLRDLDGQYAIYTHREGAENQLPDGGYGEIRRVSIRVLPRARDMR